MRAAMTLLVLLTAATGAWAANSGTYSGLSNEIGSGGNIVLNHDYYTYDFGSTIEISIDNSVIDGNGAVIDMAGSNIRAFLVKASNVTIKNLTIINCYAGTDDPEPIYFEKQGYLTNVLCNPCGDGVTWALSKDGLTGDIILTINYTGSGTGVMQDYNDPGNDDNRPWKSYCSSITRVVIGDGVTHIGDYSFYGHTALTAITIPASITNIGQEAFKNCQYLTMVRLLPATPPTLGSDAFDGIGSGVSSGDKMFYFHDTAYGSDTYSDWNDMYNHTGDFSGWSTTVFAKVAYVDADGNLHDDADGIEGTADDMATAIILDGTETTLGMKGTAASPTETWYVCQTPATENGGKGLVYDSDTDGNDDVLTLADYCHVHLILADGCLMTVNGGETIDYGILDGGYGSSLTIYGQGGTDAATGLSTEGALSVNAKDYAIGVVSDLTINGGQISASCTEANAIIAANGNLTINGGQVRASSAGDCAIMTNQNATIRGGTVEATTTHANDKAIYSSLLLTISGGQVTANGTETGIFATSKITINGGAVNATGGDYGLYSYASAIEILGGQVEASNIYANGPGNADYPGGVTLGWTSASDYIKAGSYGASNGVVSVQAGKYLSDGTNVYGSATADYVFGAEGNATLDLIAGKKLVPVKPVTGVTEPYAVMTMDDASWVPVGGTMAYLPKSYTEGDNEVALSEPLKGAPKGKPVIYGNVKDGEALTNPFFLVAASETSTDASEGETERIQADYEAKAAAMDNHFALTDGTKLETVIGSVVTPASDAIVMILSGGKFRAVDVSSTDLEKTAKSGLLLFILSKWEYMNIGSNAGGSGNAGTRGIGIGDRGATGLTPVPSPTGEGSGAWYDMQGRRIDKPARKGVYIHNGKAVVIKN